MGRAGVCWAVCPRPSGRTDLEVISVAISLSVVVLLAIVLVVMIRGGSVKAGPAIIAALFGFFLASSGVGPTLTKVLNEIAASISKISF